jgi:hypothetical protein
MANVVLKIFRGDRDSGKTADYEIPLTPGMVVLDALHFVQKHQAPDLELQSGQVRLMLRRSERPAASHLQDPHGFPSPR